MGSSRVGPLRLLIFTFFVAAALLLHASARAAESDIQLWPVVTLNHGFGERWGTPEPPANPGRFTGADSSARIAVTAMAPTPMIGTSNQPESHPLSAQRAA